MPSHFYDFHIPIKFLSYERKEASAGVTTVASSTAGIVVFFQEAEFNEVMMVPSSEQLHSGKGWACDLTAH